MNNKLTLFAFFRGINVGGHHKVPMATLRQELNALGFNSVSTLLNSGNAVFEAEATNIPQLETKIEAHLAQVFGFPLPTLLREKTEIVNVAAQNPFIQMKISKATRCYVSFLKETPDINLDLPWITEDQTYQILSVHNRMIFSFLDLSVTKTSKGMDELERLFGKNLTTRNWNTVLKMLEI